MPIFSFERQKNKNKKQIIERKKVTQTRNDQSNLYSNKSFLSNFQLRNAIGAINLL